MVDDVMFYGRGAGKLPTASAVVADVVEAVRNKDRHLDINWDEEKLTLGDIRQYKQKFFARVPESEKEAAKGKLSGLREVSTDRVKGEFAFITEPLTEAEFEELTKDLSVKNKIIINF